MGMSSFIQALDQNHPLITAGARAGLVVSNAWTPEHVLLEKMHQDVSDSRSESFWFFWLAHAVFFGTSEEARCANKLCDRLVEDFGDSNAAEIASLSRSFTDGVYGLRTCFGTWRFEYPSTQAMMTRLAEVIRLQVFVNAAWGVLEEQAQQASVAQAILLRGEWPVNVRKPARISSRFLLRQKEHAGALVGLLDGLDRARDQVLDRLDPPMSLEDRVAEAMARASTETGTLTVTSTTATGKPATPDKAGNDFKSLEID